MRERIFGRAERGEDRTLTAGSVQPFMLSSAPGDVGPNNAAEIADAYACVRALADAAAALPLHVYRRTEAGRARADGRTAELLRRPAPAASTATLIGQMVAHLNLWGNAYIGKYRDGEGQIAQLGLLAPDRVSVEVRSGEPVYTVSHATGPQTRHGTGDVIHVRALSTDGVVGLSPVRQARVQLGLSRSLTEHATAFWRNDARPSGIVKLGAGHASQEQINSLRDAWQAGHQGRHANRIAVLTGEVSYEPVAMPLDDAQFLQQRKLAATETARVFRVPPWIIGAEDGGSLVYSNVEQQSLQFVTYALRPWLTLIEQAISNDRDLCPGGLFAEFLIDGLLRADAKTRAEVFAKALDPTRGWMTRSEVRRLENLDPEDDEPAPPASPPVALIAEAPAVNGAGRT